MRSNIQEEAFFAFDGSWKEIFKPVRFMFLQ